MLTIQDTTGLDGLEHSFSDNHLLLYKSHADLGRNWTPTICMRKSHQLVTSGIYSYVRHPMYAAHILWSIAQAFMLQNRIEGFSFIVVMAPHYLLRVGCEENMMMDAFVSDYISYMKKTGRIIPRHYNSIMLSFLI